MEVLNVANTSNIPSQLQNDFKNIINNDYSKLQKNENHDKHGEILSPKDFDKDKLKEIENELNNVAASLNFDLNFQIHKDSGKIYVKIIDKNSHKVIREIPPESTLDFLSKFEKMIGILFDKTG